MQQGPNGDGGPNTFLVMEDINDKLKILDYEIKFCRPKKLRPLTCLYFALTGTYIHTYTHELVNTYRTCIHACVHTYIQTYIHANIHTFLQIYTYLHTYTHTQTHTHTHTHTHTLTHTHIHTHTHTHTHTNTHKHRQGQRPIPVFLGFVCVAPEGDRCGCDRVGGV
jgi:hypothetical protein